MDARGEIAASVHALTWSEFPSRIRNRHYFSALAVLVADKNAHMRHVVRDMWIADSFLPMEHKVNIE